MKTYTQKLPSARWQLYKKGNKNLSCKLVYRIKQCGVTAKSLFWSHFNTCYGMLWKWCSASTLFIWLSLWLNLFNVSPTWKKASIRFLSLFFLFICDFNLHTRRAFSPAVTHCLHHSQRSVISWQFNFIYRRAFSVRNVNTILVVLAFWLGKP